MKQAAKTLLQATDLLNINHHDIQSLITEKGWKKLDYLEKIRSIYAFVKNEMPFGYNTHDTICASKVLHDGYGQCNTKTTLLMTLLRAVGVPCKFHGFTVDKKVQKGILSGFWYHLAPKEILHSWTEVLIDNQWTPLEGIILDAAYLNGLRSKFSQKTTFCGFGAASENLHHPTESFNGQPTFIQSKAIVKDFGVFEHPDMFYTLHQQQLPTWKQWLFKKLVRKAMNRKVKQIRNS